MNSDLVQTFTPKNDLGESDYRYESDLISIFESVRPEVIEGLEEFKLKTTELEKQYGTLALEFAINWFNYTDKLSSDDTYNKFNFRSKRLRKQLIEGLKERGFKPSNVSKIVGAAAFHKRLQDGLTKGRTEGINQRVKKIYEFVLSQSISSQYLLGGMTDIGIANAMNYEHDTKQWDPKTDTYIVKPLTVRVLEELKQQYPINEEESRGRKKNLLSTLDIVPDLQDPITIESTEIKEVTQQSIARDIVSLSKQLNTNDGWKDQSLIKILKEAEKELMSISRIATLPIKELATN